MDLVQNALEDGRLKFVDKQKPHPKQDTETKVKALFVDLVEWKKMGLEDKK